MRDITAGAASIAILAVLFLVALANSGYFSKSPPPSLAAGPTLTIVPDSIVCTSYASCQITVQNTGGAEGWISGAGPTSGSIMFSTHSASVPAPGRTTFNISISGSTAGETVQGYLTPSAGEYLYFSTTLPLAGPTTSTTSSSSTRHPVNGTQ